MTRKRIVNAPAVAPLGPTRKPLNSHKLKSVEPTDMNWYERAACQTADPRWFYPEKGQTDFYDLAKAVCAGCPVKLKCLAYALDTDPINDWGIWGGMSAPERARVRRLRKAA